MGETVCVQLIDDPNVYRNARVYLNATDDVLKRWYFALLRIHGAYAHVTARLNPSLLCSGQSGAHSTSLLLPLLQVRTPIGTVNAMDFTAWNDLLKDSGMYDTVRTG